MTEIDVDGWDTAWFTPGSGGPQSLVLDDPSGMVTILLAGLPGDVADLVPMLERRSDGQPGWDLALSSFIPVHEGWGMGAAARDVTWTGDSAENTVAELTVMWGTPGPLVNVFSGVVDGSAGLTEVGGAPAVTYQVSDISVVALVAAARRRRADGAGGFTRGCAVAGPQRSARGRGHVGRRQGGRVGRRLPEPALLSDQRAAAWRPAR